MSHPLRQLVKEAAVAVVTKKNCPHCVYALALLRNLGATPRTYEVRDAEDKAALLAAAPAARTVPQVFVGGELVGGAKCLRKLHMAGRLRPLLERVEVVE